MTRLDFTDMQYDRKEVSIDQKINGYLALSSVALVLTVAGDLFFPNLLLLSIPLILIANIPFWQQTYKSLFKEHQVDVALVDFLSVGGSILTGHLFAAALANAFSNLSRKLLVKTEDHSRRSLIKVFGEQPQAVWVQTTRPNENGVDELAEIEIPFDTLQIGDTVVVGTGQVIPIDGTIVSGMGTIDQRALTGESQPTEKIAGDPVLASTILLSGKLYIQVEKAGQDTIATHVSNILNNTDDFKSSIQSRGQRIVNRGALPTLALSALTLPLLGVQSTLTMLYASFGYHMKMAAPISVLNFLRIASENGILIKDGRCLELLSKVDAVVFDKTGTLTEDVPTVGTIYTYDGTPEDTLLRYAAAAEYRQTHPIAQAISKETKRRGWTLPPIDTAEYEMGYGLKVLLTSDTEEMLIVRIGSSRYMEMCGISIHATCAAHEEQAHADGSSFIFVGINDRLAGAIELIPTIRPEAHEITNELRKRNIATYILSGDHPRPTQRIAEALDIDHTFAQVLPQDKANIIKQLQNSGGSICFIGDGINDSIALKTADVGISMRGASTVATDTAGIILMDGTLNRFIRVLELAHDLDANLSTGARITILPGIICVAGVFFLHFGIVNGVMLYNLGLVASVMNALFPWFKYQHGKAKDRRTV